MVYESDFYTTRRPYRTTPSLSTYTVTTPGPSRQVRILPGLGKVHVVHTYDRIVPYVGHKRLTVVTSNPLIYRVRPSVLYREFDRIENKYRPITYYSAINNYLNSDSAVNYYIRYPYTSSYTPSYYYTIYRPYYSTFYENIFDDETRLIRAQTASLLKRINAPVPRVPRAIQLPYVSRYDYDYPSKLASDYIYRMFVSNPRNPKVVDYTTYYTEPVRKYFGQGHLSCVSFAGDKSHLRRRNVWTYEDPIRNDIQLLSYYIAKFRNQKAASKDTSAVPLSATRPSRIFSVPKTIDDQASKEIAELREARAARSARIYAVDEEPSKTADNTAKRNQKKREEARLIEERAIAEEATRKEVHAKKEEAARKAEIARQEELAAKAAAERAAELERQAELARQEELAKQAAIEKARREEQEKARLEEERRQAELVKAEEERQQLLRLEEIARQAEEEREAELARQAEELAELARQEAELAELARKQEEEAEQRKKEEELAELARQEAELAELERQEKELAELAKQEAELAEQARLEAEQARKEAEEADAAQEAAELAELERQQAELDALEQEAKALEETVPEPEETAAEEAVQEDIPSQEETAEPEVPEESAPIVEEPDTPEAAPEPPLEETEFSVADAEDEE